MMRLDKEDSQLSNINEIMVRTDASLSPDILNSIYYPKIKHLMFSEINNFCKEKMDLRNTLHNLRLMVGSTKKETELREYFDGVKSMYNGTVDNIGLEYHIEVTKLDYAVVVFVVIKRDSIDVKKFVFRYRKDLQEGIGKLSSSGIMRAELTKELVGDE